MNQLLPFQPVPLLIWPKGAAELAAWHIRQEQAEAAAEIPRIWADHFASVADYWDHKRRHPDTPAGAMVILHSWCKYLSVAAAVVTLNPIVIAVAVLDVRRGSDARRALWKDAYNFVAWRINFH